MINTNRVTVIIFTRFAEDRCLLIEISTTTRTKLCASQEGRKRAEMLMRRQLGILVAILFVIDGYALLRNKPGMRMKMFRGVSIGAPQGPFKPPFGEEREDGCGCDDEVESSSPKWLNNASTCVVSFLKQTLSSQFEVADASSTDALVIDRHFAKFYALETIARVPYFSYTSVLHLYETIGNFRNKEYIKLHFDESWNELHHLLIMEELGGATKYKDRVLATHMAFFYYWIVVALYALSPAAAYNFNSHVEHHAYETYNAFLGEYEFHLKAQPVPLVAKEYYDDGRALDSLYDVFVSIRDDELEHATTMEQLERKAGTMFDR